MPKILAALIVLTGSANPWALALGIAIHLGDHHHAASFPEHSEIVELALHGHHHEEGTPRHEHPVAFAKPTSVLAKAYPFTPIFSPGRLADEVPDLVESRRILAGISFSPSESPPPLPLVLRI